MKLLTLLKFIGTGIFTLLGGLVGLKMRIKSADKQLEKAKNTAVYFQEKEQAAVNQTQEVVQAFGEEKLSHEKTKQQIVEFQEAEEMIQEIQKEADEKTETIINADIADKLKFMRNPSTPDSAS
ncbi:MAG: hypothetical protein HQ557_17005 [Bacteroidetes bacterium]|nr:hypothetical protein [Bacteroidota bacterium]